MKKNLTLVFALTLTVLLSTTSCKLKKEEEEKPKDSATTESNEAQSQWDDILKISEDAINNQNEAVNRSEANPSITKTAISEGNFIGKITVNYGTSTLGNDGRTRAGKLIIKYTGKYRTSGTVIQTTTDSFFVNGKKINGCRTVKNTNGTVFTVKDSGLPDSTGFATILHTDGKTSYWKSDRTRTWKVGSGSPTDLTDDVYEINGTGSGKTREGDEFKVTIKDLRVRLDCYLSFYTFMPASGTVTITDASNDNKRSIDYGNGGCDRKVIYTHTNGKTYELNL